MNKALKIFAEKKKPAARNAKIKSPISCVSLKKVILKQRSSAAFSAKGSSCFDQPHKQECDLFQLFQLRKYIEQTEAFQ